MQIPAVCGMMDLSAKQKQYEAAVTPVADRLLKQFTAAKTARAEALAAKDDKAAQAAKDEMDTLILFKADMPTQPQWHLDRVDA